MKTRKSNCKQRRRGTKKGGMVPTSKKPKGPHPNYINFLKRRKAAVDKEKNEGANSSGAVSNSGPVSNISDIIYGSFFPVNKNKGFLPNQKTNGPTPKKPKTTE
jgi:hypothetical protein